MKKQAGKEDKDGAKKPLIDRIFTGEVIVLPPTLESLALVEATEEAIGESPITEELRQRINQMSEGALADLTVQLKEKVLQASSVQATLNTLIRSTGKKIFSSPSLLYEPVRLRVVPGGKGANLYKASAFAPHRDSWYANSKAQVNWWIPLHDVDESQSILFYPDYFEKPIANNSEQFDYATWRSEVGFGKSQLGHGGFYPQPLEPIDPEVPRFAIRAKRGAIVIFSASHLHQSVANSLDTARISLDFRTVDPYDIKCKLGAPDPDNRSRGSATTDYDSLSIRSFLDEFCDIVEAYPDGVAVLENGKQEITYAELDQRARELASKLREHCSDNQTAVGIFIEKSTEYIVALLSIWYAGKAFVPLDPNLPKQRINHIIDQCSMKFALTLSSQSNKLKNHGIDSIPVDLTLPPSNVDRAEPLPVASTSLSDLAYIIFTSGSTGGPKGVMVEHSGIASFLKDQIEAFDLDHHTRSLFYLSTNFDASISDIGTSLLSGGTLLIEDKESLLIDDRFYELLAQRQVTYMDIPPSILKLMTPDKMPDSLKTIVIGGEVCPVEIVRLWASSGIRIVNVYGPTEATVCTSLSVCSKDGWSYPHIGTPLTGVEYKVLDENLKPVMPGDSGELFINGHCLARGYLNQPELTATKFVHHDGRRWYRTSDRILVHKNGDLEFLGRIDRQVKVRGMLVEPEEIEARIKEHPSVARVAVVKRKVGAREGVFRDMLVAFIEPISAEHIKSTSFIDSLKEQIQKTLPTWLHPNRLECLEKLPLTPSGKIDLASLSILSLTTKDENSAWEQNLSTIETKALEVILSVLKLDSIGPDDNFFDLGGDSFSTLELSLLASDHGFSIAPAAVYKNPTISDLLANLRNAKRANVLPASYLREEVRKRLASFDGINPSQNPIKNKPENIFLTGATGFLGSRLLVELLNYSLDSSTAQIFCLVRAQDKASAIVRIEEALAKQGLPPLSSGDRKRISPVLGDLGQPWLGLTEKDWNRLATTIDTIYHCGAKVNMVLPYEELQSVNLEGTVEVAKLATTGSYKHLHYASTLSVFVATDKNTGVAYESDRLEDTEQVYGGYAQSKWAAELFLLALQENYQAISIYRLGLIVGDSQSGKASDGDFLTMFLRGLQALQAMPEGTGKLALDLTPVDYAARAIMHLSLLDRANCSGKVYHIANSESLKLDLLIHCLVSQNRGIMKVSPEEFARRIRSILNATETLEPEKLATLLALCRVTCDGNNNEPFESFRTMDLFQATDITFDQKNTLEGLQSTSISCPVPSKELVSIMIESALLKTDSASFARCVRGPDQ